MHVIVNAIYSHRELNFSIYRFIFGQKPMACKLALLKQVQSITVFGLHELRIALKFNYGSCICAFT